MDILLYKNVKCNFYEFLLAFGLIWFCGEFHKWVICICFGGNASHHGICYSCLTACVYILYYRIVLLYDARMLDLAFFSCTVIDEDCRRWMVHFIHQSGMLPVWLALKHLTQLPGKSTKRNKR
jgi:hypothetical protein